jgi:hypothetical protein
MWIYVFPSVGNLNSFGGLELKTREVLEEMLKQCEKDRSPQETLIFVQGVICELLMDIRDQLEFFRLSQLKPQ